MLGLPNRILGHRLRLSALCHTFDHGSVVCPSPSVFMPIDLHTDYRCYGAYRMLRFLSSYLAIPDGECGVM